MVLGRISVIPSFLQSICPIAPKLPVSYQPISIGIQCFPSVFLSGRLWPILALLKLTGLHIQHFAKAHFKHAMNKAAATNEGLEVSTLDKRPILRGRSTIEGTEGTVRSHSCLKRVTFADEIADAPLQEIHEFTKEDPMEPPIHHSACCEAW